jgi:ABC-2 type transport system ATP-binding protein
MGLGFLYCRKLSKSFGGIVALRDIDLSISKNEVFALLGLNGAGKTTLIKCLLKLISPTRGKIFFQDQPLSDQDIQKYFSYLPESFQLPGELYAEELLSILSESLRGNAVQAREILGWAGLENDARKKIKTYSRGMLQRLGLGICFIKEPEIIFLDEPFLGLDLLGQAKIIQIVKRLKHQGKTVFFSSHLLSQAEKIADAVGIIHKGKLLFKGKIEEFLSRQHCVSLEEAFLKEIKP